MLRSLLNRAAQAVSSVVNQITHTADRAARSGRLDFIPPVRNYREREETKEKIRGDYRQLDELANTVAAEHERRAAITQEASARAEATGRVAQEAVSEARARAREIQEVDERFQETVWEEDGLLKSKQQVEKEIRDLEQEATGLRRRAERIEGQKRPNPDRLQDIRDKLSVTQQKLMEAEARLQELFYRLSRIEERQETIGRDRQAALATANEAALSAAEKETEARKAALESQNAERAADLQRQIRRDLDQNRLPFIEDIRLALASGDTALVKRIADLLEQKLAESHNQSDALRAAIRREQSELEQQLAEMKATAPTEKRVTPEHLADPSEEIPVFAERRRSFYGPTGLAQAQKWIEGILGHKGGGAKAIRYFKIFQTGPEEYTIYYIPDSPEG